MMNYIWGFMLIAGIVVSLATGRADAFTDSFLASCTDAVEFTLSLAGVMAVWSGLMKIAEESGLIDHAAKAHPYFSLSQRKKQPDAGHDDHELYGKHLRSRKQRHRIFPQSHGEARC